MAVLGDINEDLLHAYGVVRAHPYQVYRLVSEMPKTSRYYYKLRDSALSCDDGITRAARFIYLNRYCFNGVYRTNTAGKFNVPRGVKTGELPSPEAFYRCAMALRRAKLRAGDFEECLADVRPGDFVYLDPPYVSSCYRDRGEYGRNSFRQKDVGRLLACLDSIDAAGARFVLSYASCPEIRVARSRWFSSVIPVRRQVAGFGRHRRIVDEILIANMQLTSLLAPKVPGER